MRSRERREDEERRGGRRKSQVWILTILQGRNGEKGKLEGETASEDGVEEKLDVLGAVGRGEGVEEEGEEMIAVMPPRTF